MKLVFSYIPKINQNNVPEWVPLIITEALSIYHKIVNKIHIHYVVCILVIGPPPGRCFWWWGQIGFKLPISFHIGSRIIFELL